MNIFLSSILIHFICIHCISTVNFDLPTKIRQSALIISIERPQIVKENPKYFHVLNVTARRPGRYDPLHYVHLCVTFISPVNSSFHVHVFVKDSQGMLFSITRFELHYTFCQFMKMLKYDQFYTDDLTKPLAPNAMTLNNNCVFAPGTYYFSNVVIPSMNFPENFPVQKARLYLNITYKDVELAVLSQIDLELKPLPRRLRKN